MIGQKFISNKTKEEIIVLEKDTSKSGYYVVQFVESSEIRSLQKSHIIRGKFKSTQKIIGRRNTSTHGYTLEIVGYRNCNDIDVKIIETGEVKCNTYLSMFNKGTINPIHISRKYLKEDYIDKKFTNSIGLEFIILEWNKNDDILIEFTLDGFQKRATIRDIIKGHVRNDNYTPDLYRAKLRRLGQEKINSQGLKMKIVEYNHAQDIIVEFEDGYKVKTICTSFDKGVVKNPNYNLSYHKENERLGEYFYFEKYSMGGKILKYKNCDDVLFEWDDKTLSQTRYGMLKRKKLLHPKSMYKYKESFFVYSFYNNKNEIVYIGQTTDLWTRLRHHFFVASNIEKLHPDFKKHISYIKYYKCSDYEEMMSLEYNLITEFNPIYNTKCRKPKVINFTTKTFKDCEWIVYDDFEIIKQKFNNK